MSLIIDEQELFDIYIKDVRYKVDFEMAIEEVVAQIKVCYF